MCIYFSLGTFALNQMRAAYGPVLWRKEAQSILGHHHCLQEVSQLAVARSTRTSKVIYSLDFRQHLTISLCRHCPSLPAPLGPTDFSGELPGHLAQSA